MFWIIQYQQLGPLSKEEGSEAAFIIKATYYYQKLATSIYMKCNDTAKTE